MGAGSEGRTTSARVVIKGSAYHASQDAAGNAAPLAEDGARDDVHVVHSAQGEPNFPLSDLLCVILILWDGDPPHTLLCSSLF